MKTIHQTNFVSTNNLIMQIQVRNSLTLPYLELYSLSVCSAATLRLHCPEARKSVLLCLREEAGKNRDHYWSRGIILKLV